MKNRCTYLLLLTVSCALSQPTWIDRTKHKGLYALQASTKFETYATLKNPEGIGNTLKNLELAKSYFDKLFGEDLKFAVLFIDNAHWDTYAFAPPPGMPQAYYEGNMVLGLGKSVMAQRHEEALKNASESDLNQLKMHYGDSINLDLFFRDALAIHELGHLYQSFHTGRHTQRRWLNELFGNLCQIAGLRNFKDPGTFQRMDAYQDYVIRTNPWGEVPFKTLEQFEANYLEIFEKGRNYGWYQSKFYQIAKELYSRYGDAIVIKFRDFQISADSSKMGILGDQELTDLMEREFGTNTMELLTWDYGN